MKKVLFAFAFLAFLMAAVSAQTSDRDWEGAFATYKEGRFDEAVSQFSAFRSAYPEDSRADDALWFIGNAHAKAGREMEAERAYAGVVALGAKSNRRGEAVYDLAKIYRDRGRLEDAMALLESAEKANPKMSEDLRITRLLARLLADSGSSLWWEYRNAEARAALEASIDRFSRLLAGGQEPRDRQGDLIALGAVWSDLSDMAPDKAAHDAAVSNALSAWLEAAALKAGSAGESRLASRIASLEKPPAPAFWAELDAAFGAAPVSISGSSLVAWGGTYAAALGFSIPLGFQQDLSLEAKGGWNDFALKTAAFGGITTADRILRSSVSAEASVAWTAGSFHALRSLLSAGASWKLKADTGDTALTISLDERLSWRASPALKLSFNPSFSLEPADQWELSAEPGFAWYPAADLALEAGYSFAFRQYLNAAGRQYLTQAASLGASWSPGDVLKISLGYDFTVNDSSNYDVTVLGTVYPDYYDYTRHAGDFEIDLRWTPDLRTSFGADASLRRFSTYPALTAAQALTGETRQDLKVGADAEASWRFLTKKSTGFADLEAYASYSLDWSDSTHEYEATSQYSYSRQTAMAGIRVQLP